MKGQGDLETEPNVQTLCLNVPGNLLREPVSPEPVSSRALGAG